MSRIVIAVCVIAGCSTKPDVVIYCAQDREFAEGIFNDYHSQQGVRLLTKFDSEANKSVGLAAELQAETVAPRCDVHWNNEILATIRLARQGVYEAYHSPAAAGFPAWSTPRDRLWQAFAARARVIIVNTNLVKVAEQPKSIFDLTDAKWIGTVAIAKPYFGTTATHAACLFDALGPEAARDWFQKLKANRVALVPGNKQVAVKVAAGEFALGLTDTDDALIEIRAGKPVAMIFPDREGHAAHPKLGVLFIPNTLAVIKGAPHGNDARRLIDHLLSNAVEARLAAGGGFQIPLHPAVSAQMPKEIVTPSDVKAMTVDFEKAADVWDDVQVFLRKEFGG